MLLQEKKYCEYFEVDEGYYPEINESNINDSKNQWRKTFPHKTFVDLLKKLERALGRNTNPDKKPLWIEGSYGTGKSRVVWTLHNLLECSDDELNAYFDEYALLKGETDLRDRLTAHKRGRVVSALRFGSGSITSTERLVAAVYDSVTTALRKSGAKYFGATIRQKFADWLSDSGNAAFFASKMSRPEFRDLGELSGKSPSDVVALLKSPQKRDVDGLLDALVKVSEASGITAISLSMDELCDWLDDVIQTNGLKGIVLFWDEFSAFFKNNRASLDELQKLAHLSNRTPFYLAIVTHLKDGIFSEGDQAGRIIIDRFQSSKIEMPDSVAFDLIGHAMKVKSAAASEWKKYSDALNSSTSDARRQVASITKVRDDSFCKMFPLHPMAALTLKYIAQQFASNQRSMFNFIKNDNSEDLKAFLWFIRNHSPQNFEMLTVDYLWNFFYERGDDEHSRDVGNRNLNEQVAAIMRVYENYEDQLNRDEKRVLKTVLTFQALSRVMSGVKIIDATEENLRLTYCGVDGLGSGKAVAIADSLCDKGFLYVVPSNDRVKHYAAAVVANNRRDIERFIEEAKQTKTSALASLGSDSNPVEKIKLGLKLTAAQKKRFELEVITSERFNRSHFTKTPTSRNGLRVLFCCARNDAERREFRAKIDSLRQETEETILIDATSATFGEENFEKWVEYAAEEKYWRQKGSPNDANQNQRKAQSLVDEWFGVMFGARFALYYRGSVVDCATAADLRERLNRIVLTRYPRSFDNVKGSDSLFAEGYRAQGALTGITLAPKGVYQKKDVEGIFGRAWVLASAGDGSPWWKDDPTSPLSQLKKELDAQIERSLKKDGRVAVSALVDYLVDVEGFAPNNLYAMITGFLLREYATDAYRYGTDGEDGGKMTPEKLKDYISEAYKRVAQPTQRYTETYIQIMSQEQKAFVDFVADAFGGDPGDSVEKSTRDLRQKMINLKYPLWSFRELLDLETARLLDLLCEIANSGGQTGLPTLAGNFGRVLTPEAKKQLKSVLTKERGPEALRKTLETIDDGEIIRLAEEIGVKDLPKEALDLIKPDGRWLWGRDDFETCVRNLAVDYKIVRATSQIFVDEKIVKIDDCWRVWKSEVQFNARLPREVLNERFSALANFWNGLDEIIASESIVISNDDNEKRKKFLAELEERGDVVGEAFNSVRDIFAKEYSLYLEGFNEEEIGKVYSALPSGSFNVDDATFRRRVQEIANQLRKEQEKSKLAELWRQKAGRTPSEWSQFYRTPILALAQPSERESAERLFNAVEGKIQASEDIRFALDYLAQSPEFLADLNDQTKIDEAFRREILGRFQGLLTDLDKVRDEITNRAATSPRNWLTSGAGTVQRIVNELVKKFCVEDVDRIVKKIDAMPAQTAKDYLKRLVQGNVNVCVAIMLEGNDE